MFRPMAFTFMSALTATVVLSLTVMPVMASLFLARRVGGGDTFLMRFLKWLYAPVLRLAIRFPLPMVAASVAVLGLGLLVASGFGLEFVPKLDEGDIAIQAVRLPSVSLETSIEMTKADRADPARVSRGGERGLEDRPAQDRQRPDGRPPDRRPGAAQKDRSANGTSASVGRAARTMRSNSRGWPGWMRRSLRGAEELPTHAQGRVFLVGADRP